MATEHSSVDLVGADVVRPFARAVMMAALMGAAVFVTIPIAGVPGTLQALVVFLAALYLGPYWGAGSIVLYLAAGAAGAPVFSGFSAGFGVLLGPTGGFLLSFPVGAFIAGMIVHRGGDLHDPAEVPLPVVVLALVLASVVIYVAGFVWYAQVTGTELAEAFAVVAAPLIPGDLLKIAAAIAIVRAGVIDPT